MHRRNLLSFAPVPGLGVLAGLAAILNLGACGGARPADTCLVDAQLAPGVHHVRFLHGGRVREARVLVPAAARGNPPPLVLAFHGGGNATQLVQAAEEAWSFFREYRR